MASFSETSLSIRDQHQKISGFIELMDSLKARHPKLGRRAREKKYTKKN
ncbi:MAG: hypothetical protein ACXVCE_04915 [Bacteriovorax sp.]